MKNFLQLLTQRKLLVFRKDGNFHITKCFLVLYANEEKTKGRLIAFILAGQIMELEEEEEFLITDLVPHKYKEYVEDALIEALHVKDQDIGYFIINNNKSLGKIVKSIGHQISGGLKGTMLVQTINSYSHKMEEEVKLRTMELEVSDSELRDEIQKRERLERSLMSKNLSHLVFWLEG